MKTSERTRRVRGFTMIELLVAMTIGLLLTILIAQLFLGSRKTYATTEDAGRVQENMRYAHEVLTRTLRLTSYMSTPGKYPVDTDDYPGIFTGANVALDGVEGSGASSLTDVSVPDTLIVRYQGSSTDLTAVPPAADGTVVDCVGNPIGAGTIATNIFSVAVDAVSNTRSLVCQTAPGGAATTIVQDVENMQVLYGEEMTGDFTADRYVPLNIVANRDRIVSVRIALLLSSPSSSVRSTTDTTKHKLHGIEMPSAPNDTRLRRTATMTVALRNRVP